MRHLSGTMRRVWPVNLLSAISVVEYRDVWFWTHRILPSCLDAIEAWSDRCSLTASGEERRCESWRQFAGLDKSSEKRGGRREGRGSVCRRRWRLLMA